jgi:hypothetical protein
MWGQEVIGMRPEVIGYLPGYRLVAQASVPVQTDRQLPYNDHSPRRSSLCPHSVR